VRGKAEAEVKNVFDIFFRERAAVRFRQSGEIGWRFAEGGGDWPISSGVRAVTCCAVL
jgi:hypothetical protein